ncbi:hypothetical protein D3C86_1850690 [compost metagenome]
MNATSDCDGPALEGLDPCKFNILVDTGTENNLRLILFESWLTLWCQRNCLGRWEVVQHPDRTKDYQLVLKFSDPREAVHFKLASGALHVRERSEVSCFLLH